MGRRKNNLVGCRYGLTRRIGFSWISPVKKYKFETETTVKNHHMSHEFYTSISKLKSSVYFLNYLFREYEQCCSFEIVIFEQARSGNDASSSYLYAKRIPLFLHIAVPIITI